MTVQLSSLRVVADMDVGPYVAAMRRKIEADSAGAASSKLTGAALLDLASKADAAGGVMGKASKSFVDGYGTAAKFQTAVSQLGTAIERTNPPMELVVANLQGIYQRFGLVASATDLAKNGQVALAAAAAHLNTQMAAQIEIAARSASASRQMADAQQYQLQINQRLGVRSDFGGAQRSDDVQAYGKALDDLKAKYNPLYAASRQYKESIADINSAAKVGALSEIERFQAIDRTYAAYTKQTAGLRAASGANGELAKSTGLAAHEVTNLGRQIGDIVTMTASQQNPFMMLAQQGPQVADIFMSTKGTMRGFFDQVTTWAGKTFTASRLLVGGFLAMGAAAVTAALQWGEAQREVNMSLTGAGRASGASASSINAIAQSGSSTFGLSVSEARNLASQLASTGKIGVEAMKPIVAIGHDIAVAYGIDAKQAGELLAKSFSDPAKGAEELNQRLGFLDAATLRHIQTLTAQNRTYEAQRVLLDGVKQGLEGVNKNISSSSAFWTAIGNTISNVWDKVGEFAARTTGIGFTAGLDESIKTTRDELAKLEAIAARRSDVVNRALGTSGKIDDERTKLEKLTKEWENNNRAIGDAQMRRDSLRDAATVRSVLPEADARQQIVNTLDVINRLINDMAHDDGGVLLKMMGLTREQIMLVRQRTVATLADFKSSIEQTVAGLNLSIDAVGKRSPAALGDIAYKQSLLNQRASGPENVAVANLEKTLALRQANQQISDSQRDQLLSATQRVEQGYLELQIVGRSAVEQEKARSLLQAKQQLEQESVRLYGDRDSYDKKHLAALEQQIAIESKVKQTLAEQQLSRDVKFERDQIGRDSSEQQVASRLRGVYGDKYVDQLNSATAADMRLNEQLRVGKDLATDFTSGLARDLKNKVPMVDALSNAFGRLSDKLTDMAINNLVGKAFGGGGNSVNFGIGDIASGADFFPNIIPSAQGNVFYGPGMGALSSNIITRPTIVPLANGAALIGEEPGSPGEAVMPLKRINGRLGVAASVGRGGGAPTQAFHYHDNRTFTDVTPGMEAKFEARIRAERPKITREVLTEMRKERGKNPNFYSAGG